MRRMAFIGSNTAPKPSLAKLYSKYAIYQKNPRFQYIIIIIIIIITTTTTIIVVVVVIIIINITIVVLVVVVQQLPL